MVPIPVLSRPAWLRLTPRTAPAMPRLERDRAAATDEALIAWAAGGDRLAFEALSARHLPRLYAIAMRVTGRAADAEDVAQEAMLRAWQHAARFDPDKARFGTWLYRIAANLAIDHARRAPAAAPLDEALPDPMPGPEEDFARRQRRALLDGALDDLPPRQRAALALAYDQEMSGAEAAAVLDVSERALEGLLHRARRFLAGRLRGRA
jgi:RNA polymerase sigma-70 factor (ECF subfamily)